MVIKRSGCIKNDMWNKHSDLQYNINFWKVISVFLTDSRYTSICLVMYSSITLLKLSKSVILNGNHI